MRHVLLAIAFLTVPFYASAAEVCVSVAAPSVPRAYRQAVSYSLIFKAGEDQVPTGPGGIPLYAHLGDEICLQDPTIVMATVLTDQTMLDEHALQESDRAAGSVAAQQRSDAIQAEVISNDYCLGELPELESRIDTAVTNWVSARQAEVDAAANNVAGIKALIKNQLIPGIGQALDAGFTKTMKCLKARTDQGVGQ